MVTKPIRGRIAGAEPGLTVFYAVLRDVRERHEPPRRDGIRYRSLDVLAHPDDMVELMHHHGVHGTPLLVINNREIHQGFDPEEWADALGIP